MGCVHTLGSTASAPGISPHGDGLALLLHVLEVREGALKLPSVDGLGGLASVLERNSEVRAAGARALRGLDLGGGVADLRTGGSVIFTGSSEVSKSGPAVRRRSLAIQAISCIPFWRLWCPS